MFLSDVSVLTACPTLHLKFFSVNKHISFRDDYLTLTSVGELLVYSES